MPPHTAHAELGEFLRSRRERITPHRVGLPAGGRRRTPGLRREEVAQLAGVGVTWYTWLEQGRGIRASGQVLDAIARALLLDPDERDHLWLLGAGHLPGADPLVQACDLVTGEHLQLLADLSPSPACIQTAKFDILASNAAYRFMINDLDEGPVEDRNCLVRAFVDDEWKAAYIGYDAVCSRMVGRLRAALPQHLGNPAWARMIERLRDESPRFAHLWQRHDLTTTGTSVQGFRLPRVGEVTVRFTRLWLDTAANVHLTILQPVTDADRGALTTLVASIAGAPPVTHRPDLTIQGPGPGRP